MYILRDTDRYWFTRPVRYSPGEPRLHIWDYERGQFLCDDRMYPQSDSPALDEATDPCARCLRYARMAGIALEEYA